MHASVKPLYDLVIPLCFSITDCAVTGTWGKSDVGALHQADSVQSWH